MWLSDRNFFLVFGVLLLVFGAVLAGLSVWAFVLGGWFPALPAFACGGFALTLGVTAARDARDGCLDLFVCCGRGVRCC